jgi:hypothetical protein
MPDKQKGKSETNRQRVALTARLSLEAYHAITELQRQHRIQTGRALPIWKVIDAAIRAYAKQQGVRGRG